MLPLLYQTSNLNVTVSTMEYLGRLTKCEKCSVSEQLNGDYQLTATFSPTDELINEIQNQRYILTKANPFDDPQYFEIYQTDIDAIGRMNVTARHIKHSAYNNLVLTDIYDIPTAKTPQQHWNYLRSADRITLSWFSFVSSITAAYSIISGYENCNTVGGLLEEFASVFGGEYHYDNFTINFSRNRGSKKNYVLRWNRNIDSPNLSLTTASIYSHYYASAKITLIVDPGTTRQEATIFSNLFPITNSTSRIQRIYNWDVTNQMTTTEIHVPGSYSAVLSELNGVAATFDASHILQINENANLKVNFRPSLDEMSAIGLGDTVDVALKGGRAVEAKIIAATYDSLAERWESIELGHEQLKLSDYIARK